MAGRSKMPVILALLAAGGGGGYYYYSKDAPTQMDVHRERFKSDASSAVDAGKAYAQSAVDAAKQKGAEAQDRLEDERKRAAANIQGKIDEADKKVTEGATKAKGWFGSSK